ncbi:hypothetical protein MGYG_01039 [Nannizzia gypsea CBS 118893]|uniref:Acyl-coenzyme A diphosphatase SCS3 n=1 Tax=Arthroderma gypseum (strain ATCC MYA-4604 / CBS 118893) TaxID=535722 RepID=E5R3U3_ARTGP|nr:hypothetical protein MGYG_01039 [Nannizzia gypsea CBS 118893]EFQ98003.1 hypothetical protein MGYG_01039 [Nannizzia gypsea CBS 118893]
MVSNNPVSEMPKSKAPIGHLYSQPPALLLAIYPLTLIMGSIYSRISPTANPSSAASISSHSSQPVNYFARKGNVFNVYFVKIGWLWTSLAFLSLLLTQDAFTSKRVSADYRMRRVGQALLRYSLVTFSWILTTQWCFGAPIIDRGFLATGGKCEITQQVFDDRSQAELPPTVVLTSVLCKASGGTWKGGHDVSGHAFMLVLASAFLIFEMLGSRSSAIISNSNDCDAREPAQRTTDKRVTNGGPNDIKQLLAELSRKFVWTIVGLSLWMLLMTGIWFHTWLEKMSGLVLALATVYLVHILPRSLPAWRGFIGIPGV